MIDWRDTLSRSRQYVLRCNYRRVIHYRNHSTNFPKVPDKPLIIYMTLLGKNVWCGREDSNLHGLPR
jgi:hypothetical protein